MNQDWTHEQIAALVDGSIDDPQDVHRLEQILARDPAAQAYADQLRHSNTMVREAFAIPAGEKTPAAIEAAIFGEPGKVAMLQPRQHLKRWLPTSLAASLALAIGLGAGSYFDNDRPPTIAALGDAPAGGPLHTALESLPSGQLNEYGVQPMLTFRDGTGRHCREFEVFQELPNALEFGIACRSPAGTWHVEMVVAAPITEPGPNGYAPASGPGGKALDAMLEALDASPPVTPEQEADLLRRGWPASS